jgi:hypothetical protein
MPATCGHWELVTGFSPTDQSRESIMKNLHHGHCLIGVGIALLALVVFVASASTLDLLAMFVLCPLMMFIIMRTMSDAHQSDRGDRPTEHHLHR